MSLVRVHSMRLRLVLHDSTFSMAYYSRLVVPESADTKNHVSAIMLTKYMSSWRDVCYKPQKLCLYEAVPVQ